MAELPGLEMTLSHVGDVEVGLESYLAITRLRIFYPFSLFAELGGDSSQVLVHKFRTRCFHSVFQWLGRLWRQNYRPLVGAAEQKGKLFSQFLAREGGNKHVTGYGVSY